jgi:hypothetical protein
MRIDDQVGQRTSIAAIHYSTSTHHPSINLKTLRSFAIASQSCSSHLRAFRVRLASGDAGSAHCQEKERIMLTPDKELALGILDALDDRDVSSISPFGYGRAMARERTWVAQECGMIDGIYAWLERQKRQARHDLPLQQAITTLCDRLAVARDALVQDMADMDTVAQQMWITSQGDGDPTPGDPASGARKGRR